MLRGRSRLGFRFRQVDALHRGPDRGRLLAGEQVLPDQDRAVLQFAHQVQVPVGNRADLAAGFHQF